MKRKNNRKIVLQYLDCNRNRDHEIFLEALSNSLNPFPNIKSFLKCLLPWDDCTLKWNKIQNRTTGQITKETSPAPSRMTIGTSSSEEKSTTELPPMASSNSPGSMIIST